MTLDTRRTASENARHTSCGCAPCMRAGSVHTACTSTTLPRLNVSS